MDIQLVFYLIIAVISIIILSILYYPPRYVIGKLQQRYNGMIKFYKSNPNKNEIAITIDDVPYGYEQQILNILDSFNIKIFSKAVQNGHQIANHGISNSMHALKSSKNFINEVVQCEKAIDEIYRLSGIKKPSQLYYRPGCGHFTKQMIDTLKKMNYKIVLGSVYPHDPQIPIPSINYKFITTKLQKGDIVILHDRKTTPKLLKKLLPFIQQNQYECKTLEDFQLEN